MCSSILKSSFLLARFICVGTLTNKPLKTLDLSLLLLFFCFLRFSMKEWLSDVNQILLSFPFLISQRLGPGNA